MKDMVGVSYKTGWYPDHRPTPTATASRQTATPPRPPNQPLGTTNAPTHPDQPANATKNPNHSSTPATRTSRE